MRVVNGLRDYKLMTAIGIGAFVTYTSQAHAAAFVQTNLVSNIAGLADVTDPALVNPWGVSESATSPFWISDQGTNESTLITVNSTGVSIPALTVTTPQTTAGPQGPTGQVSNSTTGFDVGTTGKPAAFIFANLNGTISAWNPSVGAAGTVPAVSEVTTPGASYTGLAIDSTTGHLFAATATGINVFNSSFQAVSLPAGAFTDPSATAAGLVPFNVQEINGNIYVTYAPAGHANQTGAIAGMGAVAVFTTGGTFIQQLITGSALASPWGVTLAPASFGTFGGDLLVGNFSFKDSEINAFNATTGAFEGSIPIDVGAGNTPGGLWDLTFGNGGNGGAADTLFFSDGINGETAGLFGSITATAVPEPSSLLLLMAPALGLVAIRRRRNN
jgi:uncharacterized protein (TIGR03118 family)